MLDTDTIMMLVEGTRDTLYMTLMSTLFGYVLGLPMGIILTVTDKDGIRPNAAATATRSWRPGWPGTACWCSPPGMPSACCPP